MVEGRLIRPAKNKIEQNPFHLGENIVYNEASNKAFDRLGESADLY